ncbi:type IV secretion system DNA-binding domain-containing protein [bacterium]|nr:type IV secretion system DNA-binding domain-containing protein [bacterium]
MASDQYTIHIGTRHHWGNEVFFGIRTDDRSRHLYVIGKTGTGKTTLLKNLIIQDIEAGRGVGILDPHGDLATELLDYIPRWRTEDVVYFAPGDRESPIAFNPLDTRSQDHKHLIASGVVSAFKNVWRESWGPRTEYILYAAIAALLDCEGSTLLGVQRLLSDERYRQWVVRQIKDPLVRTFWVREFGQYETRFMNEAVAPLQNKVGQLVMSPLLRNILGQVRSRFDARFIMDNRRIFIANLSKGRIGEDKSNLLGSLLVTHFQLAAMSRADIPEDNREDFFLVIDEFQNFATDSFASILSEARKYRLCLTLSHQYLGQLRQEVGDAVFGNAGSMISFRIGQADASVLEREFDGVYSASQFSELGNHEVCAKILVDGERREPFQGKSLHPLGVRHGRGDVIVRRSKQQFSRARKTVEEKIERWISNE